MRLPAGKCVALVLVAASILGGLSGAFGGLGMEEPTQVALANASLRQLITQASWIALDAP